MYPARSALIKKIKGMTLIEMMLSLTVSFLILNSITEIYLVAQKNFKEQTALTTMQENLRMARQIFLAHIRVAGYRGCSQQSQGSIFVSPQNRLTAYTGSLNLPGSDGFTVRYVNTLSASLTQPISDHSILLTTRDPSFKENDTVVVSDCRHAEMAVILHVTSYSDGTQKLELAHPLIYSYASSAEVSEIEEDTFFIAKTDNSDVSGNPIYALYMMDKDASKKELVDGIESMKIKYWLVDDDHFSEVPKEAIEDFSQVKGISIELNLSSLNGLPLKKVTYVDVGLREI